MSSHVSAQRERLLDLLADRALVGLDGADSEELGRLLVDFPDAEILARDTELAAAAVALADIAGKPMTQLSVKLFSKIEADAQDGMPTTVHRMADLNAAAAASSSSLRINTPPTEITETATAAVRPAAGVANSGNPPPQKMKQTYQMPSRPTATPSSAPSSAPVSPPAVVATPQPTPAFNPPKSQPAFPAAAPVPIPRSNAPSYGVGHASPQLPHASQPLPVIPQQQSQPLPVIPQQQQSQPLPVIPFDPQQQQSQPLPVIPFQQQQQQQAIDPHARETHGRAPVVQLKPRTGRNRGWAITGWLAAAACLLLAAGTWYLRPRTQVVTVTVPIPPPTTPPSSTAPPPPPASSPAIERDSLLAKADTKRLDWTKTKDASSKQASGDVVWNAAEQKGYMRFRGLAKNDKRLTVYQLWIFDKTRDDKYPVDGGVFDIDEETGDVIVPIKAKLPVNDVAMFAVTIEKPGGVVVSKREHIVVLAKS